jgi:glycine cleavage system H protein
MPETYYTKEHEWVRIDGDVAAVGITAYAAEHLGDITFVELPAVGRTVKQFDALCAIESVKAASDIYAPVSGTVLSVNEELNGRPELVNESPEEAAWMATLKTADLSETSKLMNREQYDEYWKGL